jgi:hypothetical protein
VGWMEKMPMVDKYKEKGPGMKVEGLEYAKK